MLVSLQANISNTHLLIDSMHFSFNNSPSNKLPSAKCFVCFNLQCVSMSLKVGANIVRESNILDPDKKMFAYGRL